MPELRMRMDNDLLVRGMAERTRETYLAAGARLARHYRRSPDQLSPQEVQAYLVHMLREEQLAWSTCSIAVHAFRFLSHTTLGRPAATFTIPGPKQPKRLPEILSPGEVRRVIESAANHKQRAVLATTYGAGLRVSEVVRLRLHHLDAERGGLRVEQGKGAKDRDTRLSPRLLEELRAYWREYRPADWLFPARNGKGPMDVSTAQKFYTAAKGRDHEAGRHPRAPPRLRHAPRRGRGRHRPAHDPAPFGPRRPRHHHALPPPGAADRPEDDVPVGLAGPGDAPGAPDRARGHRARPRRGGPPGPLAGRAASGAVAGRVLPRGLHAPPCAQCPGPGQPAGPLRAPLSGRVGDARHLRRRSSAPRGGNWG